jgi:hypothetical protein
MQRHFPSIRRTLVVVCLAIALSAVARAAEAVSSRAREQFNTHCDEGAVNPRFSVSGWNDDATRRWLNNAPEPKLDRRTRSAADARIPVSTLVEPPRAVWPLSTDITSSW